MLDTGSSMTGAGQGVPPSFALLASGSANQYGVELLRQRWCDGPPAARLPASPQGSNARSPDCPSPVLPIARHQVGCAAAMRLLSRLRSLEGAA